MPRIIVVDTFPLSSIGKREPPPGSVLTVSDQCHQWIRDCRSKGNRIVVPAICFYEVLREMERLNATGQISRIRTFCLAAPGRFLSIHDSHLEVAAKLWAQARNAGFPTAAPEALDVDVILAAQAQSLGVPVAEYVVATTNVGHLAAFVPAAHWTSIIPGS